VDPLHFSVELSDSERSALGFIPAPSIRRRCIEPGNYVLIRDGHSHMRGYLLHGTPRRDRPLHIYQACVECSYRLRGYAATAVAEVAERGHLAGSAEINLRCATDLPAIAFWHYCGFRFRQYKVGGLTLNRVIAEMYYPLCHAPRSSLLFDF
jgi:hypothetical protein